MESHPPEFRPGGAFLLVVVCLVAVLLVSLIGSAFAADDEISIPWVVAALLVGPLAALYVGLSRYAPRETTAEAMRLTSVSRRELGLIAVAALVGGALALVVAPIDVLLLPPPTAEEMAREREQLPLLIATGLFLKPFIDELLFRGFMLPRLARTAGAWPALLIIAGVAALTQATQPVSPLLLGLGLGAAALASDTVWPAAIGHIAFECVRFLVTPMLPAWTAAPGGVVAAALVFWLIRKWTRA